MGVFGIGMWPCVTAPGLRKIGKLAEELGYESVWAPEQEVLPDSRQTPPPLDPRHPVLDPLIALALVAGVTRRLRLGTGVLILSRHDPVRLAKEVASLDAVSDGRAILGISVGQPESEMVVARASPSWRDGQAEEPPRTIEALWPSATAEQHISFPQEDACPQPPQLRVPLVVGGRNQAAFRHAVRYGSGWYGFGLDRARAEADLRALSAEAAVVGRDFGELTITVTPTETLTHEVISDYARMGVDRLVVMHPAGSRDGTLEWAEFEEFVRANAPREVGAFPA